jgi:3-oxoacyl-[acyl-carrier-protein] synthase-3
MNLIFHDRAITGLVAVVPANERKFVDEMANFNFPPARSLKLKEVMGYDRHRIVDGPVCSSDLVCRAFDHLFTHGLLDRDAVDALILVTQTPDYFMPPTSSVVQGRLGLKQDMFCMDINQGCAGFVMGLMQAFLLLDQPSIRKVALANADVLSRKVSPHDRNSYPLIGDAASITIVERSAGPVTIHANLKMDGTRCDALMIPAGGLRRPPGPDTEELHEDGENLRAASHLRMDGSAVFNFVQTEVPILIEQLLEAAGVCAGDIDYFLFHQPNRFMLEKLADRLRAPHEKMPNDLVEHYGNSSGVSIPMTIAHKWGSHPGLTARYRTCLSGFGVGLTWTAMLMPLGPLEFCELIEFP